MRFKITDSGISPRALPCAGRALVMVCSDEHDEAGHMSEDADQRIAMVDKRYAKWDAMTAEIQPPKLAHEQCEFLLVGWGSTLGAINEAVALLRDQGVQAGGLHFSELWPFPTTAVHSILAQHSRFFVVEQNRTAQLGQLIRRMTGLKPEGHILKYNGRPFHALEIVKSLESQLR